MSSLTKRQREVLKWMRGYQKRNGKAPSRIDMMKRFGFASPNAAQYYVRALERKGYITTRFGEVRGIDFVE